MAMKWNSNQEIQEIFEIFFKQRLCVYHMVNCTQYGLHILPAHITLTDPA